MADGNGLSTVRKALRGLGRARLPGSRGAAPASGGLETGNNLAILAVGQVTEDGGADGRGNRVDAAVGEDEIHHRPGVPAAEAILVAVGQVRGRQGQAVAGTGGAADGVR